MLKLSVGRLAAFAAMSALVSVASAAEVTRADLAKSEIGWRGAQLGDWAKRPYQCRDVRIAGDVLTGVVTGRDPQLNAKLAKPLVAKGNHVAHFRLRVRDAAAVVLRPVGGRLARLPRAARLVFADARRRAALRLAAGDGGQVF